jgi:hypothetical protein
MKLTIIIHKRNILNRHSSFLYSRTGAVELYSTANRHKKMGNGARQKQNDDW